MKYETLLKKLRDERIRQKVSLRKMGSALGITGQQVCAIEKGRTPLKVEYFFSMCDLLHISPRAMFEDLPEEKYICLARRMQNLNQRDYLILCNLITLIELEQMES